jgi:hypothetical protein
VTEAAASDRSVSGAMPATDRLKLLERYGRLYGEQRLAVAFTRGIRGEDAKRCGAGWNDTAPLAGGDVGAAFVRGCGAGRNPAVVLGNSNLVGIDCDGAAEVERLLALELPPTVTVQSSAADQLHFWYRPPNGETPFCAFRFERGKVTADAGRYLLCPPALHPSGREYVFLRSPEETAIAHLSREHYDRLVALAGREPQPVRAAVEEVIPAGVRRTTLLSLAGSMRRRGMGGEEIHAALAAVNERRCQPPLPADELEALADDVGRRYRAGKEQQPAGGTADAFAVEAVAGLVMRSIVFVDRPLWQSDAFHLLAGRKGHGKGTLLADLAARVTRRELGPQRSVLWIGSEDSAEIDIKPRLRAAGADEHRAFVVKDWPQFPRDIDRLAATIEAIGDVGLVIIDPVGNHITGRESNSETDVRDAIAPLNRLADEHATIIVGVRHLTEKEASKGVLASILGSSAWVQTPRAVLAVARDNDDPALSHVQCVAGNRLPPETPGRAFRLTGVRLAELENEVTRAVWEGDSQKNVEELLASRRESKSAGARNLILDVLEAADGQQMESDALDALVAQKTCLSAQTLRNIRSELRKEGLVRAVPEKDEHGSVLRWFVSRTLAPRRL